MIYDAFMYNGERDMLDIHLNILEPYVDRFVIIESKTTFTGHKKKLYFSEQERSFKKFWKKIEYYIIDENYSKEEIYLAHNSPNTFGAAHWKNEFLQKESIKKPLAKLCKDTDIVYISDVDEVFDPRYGPKLALQRMRLRVYAYYLNNTSDEAFWGILRGTWGDMKDKCLNHLRMDNSLNTNDYGGWHFTSMGGLKEVRRKLDSSYTTESYNTLDVQKKLSERVEQGKDYLGRPFNFTTDTSQWPAYLKENNDKYQHLCK